MYLIHYIQGTYNIFGIILLYRTNQIFFGALRSKVTNIYITYIRFFFIIYFSGEKILSD